MPVYETPLILSGHKKKFQLNSKDNTAEIEAEAAVESISAEVKVGRLAKAISATIMGPNRSNGNSSVLKDTRSGSWFENRRDQPRRQKSYFASPMLGQYLDLRCTLPRTTGSVCINVTLAH